MSKLLSVSDDTFEKQVLDENKPVLVHFWAEWCSPCRMMEPILDDIAVEYQEQVKVVKFNLEDNQIIPALYAVRATPTLILFKQGSVDAISVGPKNKMQLTAFLTQNL